MSSSFGHRVGLRLAEAERSQRWLSRKVGVSSTTICRILKGCNTSIEIALKIATALDVNIEWLTGEEPDRGNGAPADTAANGCHEPQRNTLAESTTKDMEGGFVATQKAYLDDLNRMYDPISSPGHGLRFLFDLSSSAVASLSESSAASDDIVSRRLHLIMLAAACQKVHEDLINTEETSG